jgi:transposase
MNSILKTGGARMRSHSFAVIYHSSVKAMVLNALAFSGQRLYMYTNFFKTVPVEHLLGKGISADDLTDDVLGRTLDAIHEYGAAKLYNEITNSIMQQHSLGTELIHVDNH